MDGTALVLGFGEYFSHILQHTNDTSVQPQPCESKMLSSIRLRSESHGCYDAEFHSGSYSVHPL